MTRQMKQKRDDLSERLHSDYLTRLKFYCQEWQSRETAIRVEINEKRRNLLAISRARKAAYKAWQRELSKQHK